MTKDKLWLLYVKKNPSFLNPDEPIKLDSKGLEKMFNLTYDQAYKAGQDSAKQDRSMFESIFGNMKL